jgi:hypothetical protein
VNSVVAVTVDRYLRLYTRKEVVQEIVSFMDM